MKKIYLYILAAIAISLMASSCDKDLPFPETDEITRGVVIDIVKVANTDQNLIVGQTTGNYQVKIAIPPQQGDYSMMAHAQLLAVFYDGSKTTSKVITDNITTFPSTHTIDMADIYSKFGKTVPVKGETLNFTMNVVLKDGTLIPGWNELSGRYNNTAFTGWRFEDRSLSVRVQYSVVDPTP